MRGQAPFPIPAVIAIVTRHERFLLVQRANPPDAGLWGYPGGKIAFGEAVTDAALRELAEETSVRAEAHAILPSLDVCDRGPDGEVRHHYILIPVLCRYESGDPIAGDDALDARWVTLTEIENTPHLMSAGVAELARQVAGDAPSIRL